MKRSPFCLLKDPSRYVACSWDLAQDTPAREHWVGFFIRHFDLILSLGTDAAVARGEQADHARARADACRTDFLAKFRAYEANPTGFGRVTILLMDDWRDGILRKHGFDDAFVDLKARENDRVLPLLAGVCRELDGYTGAGQMLAAVQGVFAGNLFDMGAEATAAQFMTGTPHFDEMRQKVKPRPWLIDQYDAFADRIMTGPAGKLVFFIDNAGADFILGALPFMRWMCQRGWRVVLAANERPALNDMTIHDVNAIWPHIIEAEPSFATLPIQRVSTGTGEPLIDLLAVSDELNSAAADADLVMLEGMGRGVESNLDAAFTCNAVNIAMIKDQAVARRHGGTLYDLVLHYR